MCFVHSNIQINIFVCLYVQQDLDIDNISACCRGGEWFESESYQVILKTLYNYLLQLCQSRDFDTQLWNLDDKDFFIQF